MIVIYVVTADKALEIDYLRFTDSDKCYGSGCHDERSTKTDIRIGVFLTVVFTSCVLV